VVALGKYRETIAGDSAPRQVLILVEWASRGGFESYCRDPRLAGLHAHRVPGRRLYLAIVRPARGSRAGSEGKPVKERHR